VSRTASACSAGPAASAGACPSSTIFQSSVNPHEEQEIRYWSALNFEWSGCVIANASAGVPAVKALVYVAAFAPEGDADGYIDPAYFHELFCAGLKEDLARFTATAQRAVARSCLATPSGTPGWRTIPSWYMVSANDATIPPEAERAMAARAGATTVEVPGSHVSMISHPHEVAELIAAAANA
jgi:pimeloyl-ACP methyl ester carboxylesterase